MSSSLGPTGLSVGQILSLNISSLSYNGGRGVARTESLVFFVGRTVPGDEITARITELHKNYGVAELVSITTPSPERRETPCPIANRCGGCSWQQVSYKEQVRQKELILKHSLKAVEKLAPVHFLPFIAAESEFRYRNRIQVHRSGGHVGFFAKGTREVVATDDCLITELEVAAQIKSLTATATNSALERLEIARLVSGEVTVRSADKSPESSYFAQVNNQQNQKLIELVEQASEGATWKSIVDLYSGSGNFTFPLAKKFPTTDCYGVDLSKTNINLATQLTKHIERPGSWQWFAQSVDHFLKDFKAPRSPWLVVVDPPRPGCDGSVIQNLLHLAPDRIIYVSCNPTTFARDACRLLETKQFVLMSVQGLDMFPQTEHVELVGTFIATRQ